jgi:hypothetical protein
MNDISKLDIAISNYQRNFFLNCLKSDMLDMSIFKGFNNEDINIQWIFKII